MTLPRDDFYKLIKLREGLYDVVFYNDVHIVQLIQDIDGYYLAFFDNGSRGGFGEQDFKAIYEIMHELNKPINDDIIRYFTVEQIVDEIDTFDNNHCGMHWLGDNE